jgi:hypothetical protein
MTKEYKQTFSIPMTSKFFSNWDFWFENIPSGNPAMHLGNFLSLDLPFASIM